MRASAELRTSWPTKESRGPRPRFGAESRRQPGTIGTVVTCWAAQACVAFLRRRGMLSGLSTAQAAKISRITGERTDPRCLLFACARD